MKVGSYIENKRVRPSWKQTPPLICRVMFRIWSSGRSIKLDARGGKTSADVLSFNFVKIAGSIATKKQTSFGALLENYRFLENFQVRHLFLFLLPSSRSPRKWWKNMGICTDSGLTWMDSCNFVVTLFSLFTWFHVFVDIGTLEEFSESTNHLSNTELRPAAENFVWMNPMGNTQWTWTWKIFP